ncbi:flagellar hook-length control protein FliK [Neobacillus mesonae]|nr:flagellar hook-length control protein FliK [Neobacillus mesonae]
MNIGQAIRGLLGDPKPANGVKPLELKEGMVVRAEVIQVSPDQKEAVLQIKGVQVRAALDTPLVAGQNALLQVGGQNKDGMMVMKPFQGTLASVSTATLAELLTNLQLPDTKENRTLVSAMQQSGVPLSKDNVKLIQSMMNVKPAAAGDTEWITSASLAMQRGLPVTASTVSGLYYAMFGPALNEMLGQLDSMLGEAMKNGIKGTQQVNAAVNTTQADAGSAHLKLAEGSGNDGGGSQSGSVVQGDKNRITDTVMPGRNQGKVDETLLPTRADAARGVQKAEADSVPVRSAQGTPGLDSANAVQASQAEQGKNAGEPGAERENRMMLNSQPAASASEDSKPGSVPKPGAGMAEEPAVSSAVRSPDGGASAVQGGGRGAAAGGELVLRAAALLAQLKAAPEWPAENTGSAGGGSAAATSAMPQQDGADAQPAPGVHTQATTTSEDSWVARVLKLLGAEHEQQVVRGALAPAQAQVSAAEQTDTLKSVLMQMEASPELPASIKDTAGQLVHLLTGHQLLMNTDRTAPFAQMNWFIPLTGADGQTTANVQIQSRRGPRGEMDASHCRIWFDLNMKQLGPTLIDMQVAGKVISLHIHTDNEMAAQIFEQGRAQVDSALQKTGYQLSLFKSEVVVRDPDNKPVFETSSSAAKKIASYVPESYKGVDMRV